MASSGLADVPPTAGGRMLAGWRSAPGSPTHAASGRPRGGGGPGGVCIAGEEYLHRQDEYSTCGVRRVKAMGHSGGQACEVGSTFVVCCCRSLFRRCAGETARPRRARPKMARQPASTADAPSAGLTPAGRCAPAASGARSADATKPDNLNVLMISSTRCARTTWPSASRRRV